ncbi:hypothetical protein ACGFI3_06595 [Nonomuraea wenchangensis]|uniref:hypothetical protein n=1 Tax=Nonomuraea wenchangensis TaxID=568860 RepID=UPI00371C95C1
MSDSPTATAPGAAGPWTRRLHLLLTTALVLGVLAFLARLIADVILALPTAKADYGFTGLWPSHARVSLDGALAPGVRAVDVVVEATLHDPARAPLLASLHLLTWLPGALVMLFSLFWLVRITTRGVAGDRTLFSADTVRDLRRVPGDVGSPLVAVLMGVGAFVVAEVIGRGLAMLDELEGTI